MAASNEADSNDFWETYLAMRELAIIATCVLFFLCGAWWFVPMNYITLSFDWARWTPDHAQYAWATVIIDIGIAIVVGLAVLTYKRLFFLPLFLIIATAIAVYLLYLALHIRGLGM